MNETANGNTAENDGQETSSGRVYHVSSSQQTAPLGRLSAWAREQAAGVRPRVRRAYVGMAAGCLLLSGLVGFGAGWLGARQGSPNGVVSGNLSAQKQIVTSESQLTGSIAKSVGPSVVSVNVTSTTQGSGNGLFGFGGLPESQQSAGTGIIITAAGLIITNRHVVPAGTTSVSVTLSDGTILKDVSVLGRTSAGSSLDIAFLKINNADGKHLVPAQLGDSSKVQVGDAVVAIGNALGQFQNTVTSGIISGYGRSVQASSAGSGQDSENLEDLFQTDAAINEGNSGGPLVNLNGQVIGINTAIAGDAQNIGFAIPINDVIGLVDQVEHTGKLQQPYLGVYYIPLTDDVAQQYNLQVKRGAWIPPEGVVGQKPILVGGPAGKAGLKSGDIITKIDNTSIDQNNSLTSIIDKDQVGQTVTLTVVRSGRTMTIRVMLGAAPADTPQN